MKNIGVLVLVAISLNINAQDLQICEGHQLVPTGEINLCNTDPYILVFEEEFDGNELDLSAWKYGSSRIRICNPEQQYYTHGDNHEVSDGKIHLIAEEETLENTLANDSKPATEHLYCDGVDKGVNERDFYYTSENIESERKFSYGYYEAKVRIPKGKGLWPAFWLYGGDPVYNEIDIFEFWTERVGGIYQSGRNSRVHHMSTHYDYDADGDKSSCGSSYMDDDFSADDHIFALVWEPDKIEWYVDNDLKLTAYRYWQVGSQPHDCTVPANLTAVLNEIYPIDPMSIIFNLAIESGADAPDSQTEFPSQMSVDWVRYYKKSSIENVTITNSSQLALDDDLFNALIGSNVEIDCNYTIPSDQQLEIIATNSVTIGPGFSAELGSLLNIRID